MDKEVKTSAADPATDAGGASEVFEGEVVGHDLSALMKTVFDELQAAQENHHISTKTALIAGTVLKDWYGYMASSGCTTIQLPEEL